MDRAADPAPCANDEFDADVVIVGAGPVGLTLANLLGQHGVNTLVVERNAHLEGEPRAVTIDDESLRTLQGAGLLDQVLKNVVLGYGVRYFGWNGKPLAAILPTVQNFGYPKRNAFLQPRLVEALAEGAARFAQVRLRFGEALSGLAQDAGGVTCTLDAATGGQTRLRARWLVACDGGRSTVRELCGITLDGMTFDDRWLIVDLAGRTDATRDARTYCDPRRPAIRLPGPHGALRYEFMVRPQDKDEELLDEATFRRWIAARVPSDAGLPLVRKAIYGFHARVAQRWQHGRVLLAGDAAHLTPPFAGQGVNSGIRDAANLAWKLAAVMRWGFAEGLVATYEPERRPHATALIRMALRIGTFMQPKTMVGARLMQTALRLACLVPACRDYILQLRFKPKAELREGFFQPSARRPSAELLHQPQVEHPERGRVALDTLLGEGFAVIGWDSASFRAHASAWVPAGAPYRLLALIHQGDDFLPEHAAEPGAESVAESVTPGPTRARDCTGILAALMARDGAVALVVRPDRYVYRAVAADELSRADAQVSARTTDAPLPVESAA
jgi:3-(3-hydroxy-phenyl)propionate hydroxylase